MAKRSGETILEKSNRVPYAGDAFLVRSVTEVDNGYDVLEAYVLFLRLDAPLQHDERSGLMWSKADTKDIDLTADDILHRTLYRNALRIARDTVQEVTPDGAQETPVLELRHDVELSALTPLAATEWCRATFKTIEDRTFNETIYRGSESSGQRDPFDLRFDPPRRRLTRRSSPSGAIRFRGGQNEEHPVGSTTETTRHLFRPPGQEHDRQRPWT